MRDAERLARSLELAEADAGDLGLVVALFSGLDPARCVAELAVRARDDNGSHALVRVPGQDAARARRLVVGVRVHGHQRQRRAHPASLSRRLGSFRAAAACEEPRFQEKRVTAVRCSLGRDLVCSRSMPT